MNKTLSPKMILDDILALSLSVKLYLLALTIITAYISLSWGDPWYGTLSTISGVLCVVLVAERKLSNYAWGIINCALYGLLSYNNQFYGDMSLNWFIYLPFQFIGFYLWSSRIEAGNVKVQALNTIQILSGIPITVVMIGTLAFILKHFGGANPYVDSANTVLSIIATVLMAKCYREQWLCWILVNVTGIVMWGVAAYQSGGAGVAGLIMWLAFFVNSVYGYWQWTKQSKVPVVPIKHSAGMIV